MTESVSSDSDPESDSLRARLFEGSYTVSLLPESNWYLERLGEGEPVRVEQAVLLSSSQQTFVDRGLTSRVAFQFGVDGELIDFYGGDLQIDIAIQNAPAAGAVG